jgi:hypothetical protein
MKNFKLALILFSIFVSLTSCKKGEKGDTGPAGPAGPAGVSGGVDSRIYNKWEVVSGTEFLFNWYAPSFTSYLIINSDNTSYYLLEDTVTGFRNYIYGMALATASEICMASCYNYQITGDTLKLTDPFAGTCVLVKNPNAPGFQQWIGVVTTSLDSIALPPDYYGNDICFDGQNIWLADNDYEMLYKVNPSTHNISTPFTLSFYPSSVEFSGGFLWVGDYYELHKISPTNGSELFVSQSVGTSNGIYGMAWDNQYMWCNDNYTVSKFNLSSNSIVSQGSLPSGNYSGSAYANGYFYIASGNAIFKCSLLPFQVEKTYVISFTSGGVRGIAYDGNNFWISTYEFSNYVLYKVALN